MKVFDEHGRLSAEFLLSRNSCCNRDCFNCPYKGDANMSSINGLTYEKPFKSELELELYNLFSTYSSIQEDFGKYDLKDMSGMDKKNLIEKIHKKYNINKKKSY